MGNPILYLPLKINQQQNIKRKDNDWKDNNQFVKHSPLNMIPYPSLSKNNH